MLLKDETPGGVSGMSLKRKLFCDILNLHVGRPEKVDDRMMFYCTRCEKHTHPISPERTEKILREMYEEEGYDYDEIHK